MFASWRQQRTVMAAVAVAAMMIGAGPASAAIKLIHMHNGRTLKAMDVERDGDWVMATLSGGNTIGFPASTVEFVEDDPLGREEYNAGPTNVVTSGREVARSALRGRRNAAGRPTAQPAAAAPKAGGAVRRPGVVAGGAVGQAAGQPVGATPGQGANARQETNKLDLSGQRTQDARTQRFNRLGLRQRTGDN